MYRIRHVDGDEWAEEIHQLQLDTGLFPADFLSDEWWLTFYDKDPIAYCCICPFHLGGEEEGKLSTEWAYLGRVGVLKPHVGHRLQVRMMRLAVRWARDAGFKLALSDTTDRPFSANNFIRAGWSIMDPQPDVWPWSGKASTIYWKKNLVREGHMKLH